MKRRQLLQKVSQEKKTKYIRSTSIFNDTYCKTDTSFASRRIEIL